MAQKSDRSRKWLLEHQGRGLAMLGGLRDVVSCKSIQAEVAQPIRLPDGLLEVRLRGQRQPLLLLVEFCTYPESRTSKQMMDCIMLVIQARKVLPEMLALVLCPKGNAEVPQRHEIASKLGWTRGRSGGKYRSCGICPRRRCWPRPTSAWCPG